MTATTTTTIQGVSVLSRQRKLGHHDEFELGLSPAGIEVRRPGRPVQQMSWDRVSEWEIEERKGFVVLTLRGRGATTPLLVPGWTLDDLEVLMRDITSDATAYQPNGPGPVMTDGKVAAAAAGAAASAPPAKTRPKPAPSKPARPKASPPKPAAVAAPAPLAATTAPVRETAPTPSRAERRQQAAREKRLRRLPWKTIATVALLGILATAVIVVLLQSAGIIDWSFLGPVA